MKKYFLIVAVVIIATLAGVSSSYSQSEFSQSYLRYGTTPGPFAEIASQQAPYRNTPAISTGYWFAESGSLMPTTSTNKWKPTSYTDEDIPSDMAPGGLLSRNWEPNLWRRIYRGYRSTPPLERETGIIITTNSAGTWYTINPPKDRNGNPVSPQEGYRYFRNPGQWAAYTNPASVANIDSTHHAFAGPIPLGFAFHMNGLRYDSFYVSTTGVIALSNRRYMYDGNNARVISPLSEDCYDPNSADWPFVSQAGGSTGDYALAAGSGSVPDMGRTHFARGSAESLNDPIPDNYGFQYLALGNNLYGDGGIRSAAEGIAPTQTPPLCTMFPIQNRLSVTASGGAFITVFDGPFYLPQRINGRPEDRGQVWYKRDAAGNKLIIYFENFQMAASTNNTQMYNGEPAYQYNEGGVDWMIPIKEGTPGVENTLEGSVQVELNRLDSSITIRYGNWSASDILAYNKNNGNGASFPPHFIFSKFASIAVGGYARHTNYNSKTGTAGEGITASNPWAAQYKQYTPTAYNYVGISAQAAKTVNNFTTSHMVKFKQWRNSLRLVDIQYMMKQLNPTATLFNKQLTTTASQNQYDPLELLAGHNVLGQVQPIAIVQNLTSDIQGQKGVNFVEQDFQFQAVAQITNVVTDRVIYNRTAKIADTCLTPGLNGFTTDAAKADFCSAELVRWGYVDKDGENYTFTDYSTNWETSGNNGLPPYNVAEVRFPAFNPGENEEQLGLMELKVYTDATHPVSGARVGDQWPVDDSSYTNFWVISRVSNFRSNSEFHYSAQQGYIPDVTKWVNARQGGRSSVEVMQALGNTSNPLPPLGMKTALNSNFGVNSPLYRFSTVDAGSKITSFPIDLRHKQGSMVTLGVQKGVSGASTARGFADNTMVGPEARVSFLHEYESKNASPGSGGRMAGFGNSSNTAQTEQPDPDYLYVEYLTPSADGVKGVISTGLQEDGSNVNNVTIIDRNGLSGDAMSSLTYNALWRNHREYNAIDRTFPGNYAFDVLNAPALAVFGGGGYFVGWTFADGKTFFPSTWNFGGNLQGGIDVFGGSGVVTLDRYTQGATYNNAPLISTNGEYSPGHEVVAGLMPNPYDIGFDDEFHRYSVVIPNSYIDVEAGVIDGGQNFRFRIRANDIAALVDNEPKRAGKGIENNPSDDNDYFLVDNVAVMSPNALPDLEAQVVKILWPYATVPISQATNMQMIGRIANMGNVNATNFNVKLRVYKGGLGPQTSTFRPDVNTAIFCQSIPVPSLEAGKDIELTANNVSLREYSEYTAPGMENVFSLQMIINSNNNDQYTLNDTIYSEFRITYDTVISYVTSRTNDVPAESGIAGKGLNLGGNSIGGFAVHSGQTSWQPSRNGMIFTHKNNNLPSTAPYGGIYLDWWSAWGVPRMPWTSYVTGGNLDQTLTGHPHGYISGQIAVKFELRQADSLRGVVAQFGAANQEANDISFNVYADNNGLPSDQPIQNASLPLLGRRLYSKSPNGTETMRGTEVPVLYEFNRSITLPAGVYWISIDQRGQTGLELAASGEGMGMRTMRVHAEEVNGNILALRAPLGTSGLQLLVNKRLRVPAEDPVYGRVYQNNNIFAYKNVLGSANAWQPFMPTIGNVAYPHLNHLGMLSPEQNSYSTFTRGTWAPLLTPYFGNRNVTQSTATQRCPDDVVGGDEGEGLSINVSSFNAYGRKAGVELIWEAVTNETNLHFVVEKTEAGETDNWQVIEHLTGNASSTYSLLDADVISGKTYKYRLYNMYPDGSITCQNSNMVTIDYNNSFAVELSQNTPNPFSSETNIDVTVPEAQYVTVEILDIFGKVVNTLANNELLQGSKRYIWNGCNSQGLAVADGHYIYRLTAGNETITKKMSLIRAN